MSETIKQQNNRLLDRIRGVKAQPGTPETDADPRNPNADPRDAEITRLTAQVAALTTQNSEATEGLKIANDTVVGLAEKLGAARKAHEETAANSTPTS